MQEWILGGLISSLAVIAMLVQRLFSKRKEEALTQQREEAIVESKQQSIKAEVKAKEILTRKEQQKREDSINASYRADVADKLDHYFK